MDPIVLIMCAIIFVLVIVAIIGSRNHVRKAAFKPKFMKLGDGTVNMEFYNFGGLQTARTKRFYEQYKVGMQVSCEGKEYRIAEFKEVAIDSLVRSDVKIVAYLEEGA